MINDIPMTIIKSLPQHQFFQLSRRFEISESNYSIFAAESQIKVVNVADS